MLRRLVLVPNTATTKQSLSSQRRWFTKPLKGPTTTATNNTSSSTTTVPPTTLFGSLIASIRSLYSKACIWLLNNAASLLSYQLLLETIFTGTVSYGLLQKYYTVDDVKNYLERMNYPLLSWVDFTSGVYKEPYRPIPTAPQYEFDPHTMTAVHSGHNIVMGFLPFQLMFLFATYPLACKAFAVFQPIVDRVPILRWLFGAQLMPAELSHWVNKKMGSSIGTTAVSGAASSAAAAAPKKAAASTTPISKASAGAKPNWRQKK